MSMFAVRIRKAWSVSLLTLALLAVGAAQAATRYVGACGSPNNATIAAAIAAASAGDTILVCSGTYNEAVTVNKDNLTIRSSTGNRADVTVSNSGTPFTLSGAASTLKDMTITSTNNRGIFRGWTGSPSAYTFENLAISAKQEGAFIDTSAKITFTNINVASSNSDAINLRGGSVGAHVFDTITANAKDYGIRTENGGTTFKDLNITAGDRAIYIKPTYDATFTNIAATSTGKDGVYLDWTASGKTLSFSNVTVTSKDYGIFVNVSAKVTMTNVTATSSNSDAINLGGATNGAHVFDTITATGKTNALYTYNGGATFKDITASATDNYAIYMRPNYDATFTSVTATSSNGAGIYMGWAASGKALSFSNVSVSAKQQGIYIEVSGALSFQNMTVSSSNGDAIELGYGASGAHVMQNLTLDASGSGILYGAGAPSAAISNVCVNSGQYGVRITQWGSKNVSVSNSKFTSSTRGVYVAADPTYKTTVSGSCIMKSTTPRAYSNSTTHTFNGNYWQGVAGGTNYVDGNVHDTSTLASCPVTSCYAPAPSPPIVDWRMDEASWNGTAAEVKDSGSNAKHGYALNGATTAAAKLCRGGSFDGVTNRSVYLPPDMQNLPGLQADNFTMALWVKPGKTHEIDTQSSNSTTGTSGQNYALYPGLNTAVWNWDTGGYAGAGVSVGTNGISVYEHAGGYMPPVLVWAGAVSSSEWTHVAVVYNGGVPSLYVNGAFKKTGVAGTNPNHANVVPTFRIGSLSYGNYQGGVDEYKIFSEPLTAVQIAAVHANEAAGNNWDGTTRTCPVSGPDHIRAYLDNNDAGLTCAPRSLSAIACNDAACTTRYASDVGVTLSPSGTTATIPAGGTGSPTIASTTAGTASVTLASSSPVATGSPTFRCYSGTVATPGTEITGSCNISFSDAGFFVSVPDHVSCTTQALTITAAKTDDVTKKCVPAFDSGTSRTIKLKFGYNDPGSGASTPIVPAVGSADPPDQALATAIDLSLSMAFTSGAATTNFRYNDAGKLTVTASYTGSAGTGDAGLSMSTVSNPAFVVAPASFALSGIPTTLTAGTPFNVTLTATNNCGGTTKNFGREATAEGATFASSNPAPALGNATAISQASSTFTDGVASTNLTWNEVGTIDLAASNSTYLGSALDVTGSQANVGAFRPAYFDTVVTHGCSGTFTYAGLAGAAPLAGQPFTVEVKAKRAGGTANDNTNTKNYAGATWAKAVTLSDAAAGAGTLANNTFTAANFADGKAQRNDVTYAMAAKLTAPYALAIRAVDADGVTSEGHTEGSTTMRSGRLRLSNAFGTENSNLAMPVQAQYWSGSSWVLNSSDSCTAISAARAALSGYTAAWTTSVTPVTLTLAGGQGNLVLAAPTPTAPATANTGSVSVALNLGTATTDTSCLATHPAMTAPTASLAHLRGMNGSCPASTTYTADPSARATFGIYSPETRRTVHVREAF